MKQKYLVRSLLVAMAAAAATAPAMADSLLVTGVVPNAAVHLDFQITIPRVLSFRVGNAAAGTIDMITFAPAAAALGNSVAVAGAGGDLGGGAVTAAVTGNNGQITVTATTVGALGNGVAGQTIPWSQITTTAAALGALPILAAPVLPLAGAGVAVNAPVPVANVTQADATWTYKYLNTIVPAAGTYGGVNLNNGRVTYTAAMP